MTQTQTWLRPSLRSLLTTILLALPMPAIAQVQPIADDTLGNERSLVSPNTEIRGIPSHQIDGGARRGANLFHSFQEFNIDAGRGAYFTNPDGVANILARVTGGDRSNILGTLGVLGNANLFLINPNGILFGPNARLDLGGSFISSTADSVLFDHGFVFSAIDPQAPPLLTVNVPIGLQYGSAPGVIQTQGASLQMQSGQTLTLVGGNVTVDGGQLLAPGGRVELVSVAAPGLVGLTQQGQEWWLNVSDGLTRGDVAIGNAANVNVRAGGGGSIAITARHLMVSGLGTGVRAGIATDLGTVSAQAGDIDIHTTETVSFDESVVVNTVLEGGIGNAGNININTGRFSLTDGAQVDTSTFGRGNAGNLTIVASNAVSFQGVDNDGFASGALSSVQPEAIGQGGNITINTDRLTLTRGGFLNAGTLSQGDGGNITITARDAIVINGQDSPRYSGSSALSSVGSRAIGQGGNFTITTGSLFLNNGGQFTTTTSGQGDAGDITITARDTITFRGSSGEFSSGVLSTVDGGIGRGGTITITTGSLRLIDGGLISAGISGRGIGGDIVITAKNAVSFRGVGSNGIPSLANSLLVAGAIGRGGNITITASSLTLTGGAQVNALTNGQGNAGNIMITARDSVAIDGTFNELVSGVFSSVESEAVGRGGRITVETDRLSITGGGRFITSSFGQGRAGDLDLNARQLLLGNGSIVAETDSGQGGDVTLQVPEFLLLQNQSSISTTAGTDRAGGDGGNITFTGDFIVAVPNANSDISANAFTGRGGNVEINAQSVFGIQPQAQLTPQSDITASSDRGVAGVVTLNTSDVDPNRGLVELPTDVTDASRQIAQTCPTGDATATQANEFIITGRGGLPATPSEAVNPDAIQVDLVTVTPDDRPVAHSEPSPTVPIVEAQGWQVTDGKISLVAAVPQRSIDRSIDRLIHCP